MTYLEFLQKSNVDDMAKFIVALQLQAVEKFCKNIGMEVDPTKSKDVLVADCKKALLEEI